MLFHVPYHSKPDYSGGYIMHIHVILFDGFETLDAFGPIEVLARDNRNLLNCYSLAGGTIVSAQGTEIITRPLCEASSGGAVLLPGGRGTRTLVNDDAFLHALRSLTDNSEYCLSICTGSALLAKAGLLNGRKATSNKKAFDWVASNSDKVFWQRKARWVVDGKFYTASGVSAGIDMALGFLNDMYSQDTAKTVAKDIEYIWNENKDDDPFEV